MRLSSLTLTQIATPRLKAKLNRKRLQKWRPLWICPRLSQLTVAILLLEEPKFTAVLVALSNEDHYWYLYHLLRSEKEGKEFEVRHVVEVGA